MQVADIKIYLCIGTEQICKTQVPLWSVPINDDADSEPDADTGGCGSYMHYTHLKRHTHTHAHIPHTHIHTQHTHTTHHTHTHTHTYTRIHTHTHTHTHTRKDHAEESSSPKGVSPKVSLTPTAVWKASPKVPSAEMAPFVVSWREGGGALVFMSVHVLVCVGVCNCV